MRLTADLLLRGEHYLNAYDDRELNMRGFKISAIENLAVLQDQFDVIDFSNNDIKKLDNFPVMNRLNAIIMNNNSIVRISPSVGNNVTNLTSLILTNNRIGYLSELQHLSSMKNLQYLSLLDNAVIAKPNYQLYTIYILPSLKWLDFKKITMKERDESKAFFKSSAGKSFLQGIEQEAKIISETGAVMANMNGNNGQASVVLNLTEQQKQLIKILIENATTRDQIDHIEKQLKVGNLSFLEEKLVESKIIMD